MAQATITVRGNLGATPDFLPAKAADDGTVLQARLSAVVYESRRVRTPDGRWEDDPRGPVKAKIQLFGRNAEIVHRLGMQQGDPVIAGGTLTDPAAFVSPRDGEMDARTVINAAWLVFDSIRVEQRRTRDDSTDSGQSAAGPSMDA